MSKASLQKKDLENVKAASGVKASNKVEGKGPQPGKGNGKNGGYKLADGTLSVTKNVKPATAGTWHYYAPRKHTVMHDASLADCVKLLKTQYHIDANVVEGQSWKFRFWVHDGICSIKSFAGKTAMLDRQAVLTARAVKQKVAEQPVKVDAKTVAKTVKTVKAAKTVTAVVQAVATGLAENRAALSKAAEVADVQYTALEQLAVEEKTVQASIAKALQACKDVVGL